MTGPITNFELGKMQHREYEAEASRYWGQNVVQDDNPGRSKKYRLTLALSGAVAALLVVVQIVAI